MNDTIQFLIDIGCRKRGEIYILDGFDHEFYLAFDASEDPETPLSVGCVDIYAVQVGMLPNGGIKFRLVADANKFGVMRMLSALGIQRFSVQTKTAYYALVNPLRKEI